MPRRKGSNRASSAKRGVSASTSSSSSAAEGKRTRASHYQSKKETSVPKSRPGRLDHESSSTSSNNSNVSSPMRKSRGRGATAASSRTASQSSSSRATPPESRASSSSSNTSSQRALNNHSTMKRAHSNSVTSEPLVSQRQPLSPVNTTPAVEPVEQRWEESEGTYLHKKFKKMASAVQSVEANPSTAIESTKESSERIPATTISSSIPSTSIPTVPIPTVIFEKHDLPVRSSASMEPPTPAPAFSSQFPLKHSALSMLVPSAQPIHNTPTTMPLSSKVYVPAPSPSPSKSGQSMVHRDTHQALTIGVDSSHQNHSHQIPSTELSHLPMIRLQPQSNLLVQQQQGPIQNIHSNHQGLQNSHPNLSSPPNRHRLLSNSSNIQPINLRSSSDINSGAGLSTLPSEAHHPVAPPIEENKKSNKKRNECPFCQIVCAKPSVLDKHIRTHTNERPYPCEPCGFAFKTKSNLYKHKKSRTHNLKVEKGIDSHSEEIVAELGEGIYEERDQISTSSQGSSHPHSSFPHVVLTQAQSASTQAIGMNNILTTPSSNHSRIPTMPLDSRLPLILSSHNPQSQNLSTSSRHQVPRFLTNPGDPLRPEQPFVSGSLYTAKHGHLPTQPGIQSGMPRFIRQNEPHSHPRATIPTQHPPLESNQYSNPITTNQITSHERALASHHRAIAVASLTQVSTAPSSLGAQRNSQLQTRPPLILDQSIGPHMQRIPRPILSSPELQPNHRPSVIVATNLREQQQQATDLSKAIRSSAAAAVAAVTQRPYQLPQVIPTPLALVKDLTPQQHQYTNTSKPIATQDHPPHILQSLGSSPPPLASLPSGFTVSQIPNTKHQRHPVHNNIPLSSPPALRLPSSPSLSLTTISKPPSVISNDNEPRDLSSQYADGGKPLTLPQPNIISNRMPLIQLPQQPLPNALAHQTNLHQPAQRPRADVHVIDPQHVTRPILPTAPLPITVSSIAASVAQSIHPSSSMPTDLSTKGGNHGSNSPKKSGPDNRIPEIQQRIDKVISENQAIVETLDPLWPRRYMRQSSKDKEKDSTISLVPTSASSPEDTRYQQGISSKSRYTSVVKYSTPVSTATQLAQSQPQGISNNPATVILNTIPPSVPSSSNFINNSKPLQFPQQPLPALHVVTSANTKYRDEHHHQNTVAPSKLPLTTLSGASMLPKLPDSVLKSMRQQETASPKDTPLNLVSVPTDANIVRTRTFSLPSAVPTISAVPQANVSLSSDSPLKEMTSVREVWVNSNKKPLKSTTGNVAQLEDLASSIAAAGAPPHPQNPEKSMIKALLLEAGQRNAGHIPPIVGPTLTVTPSDGLSNNSIHGGSINMLSTKPAESQIVIEVKNTKDGDIAANPAPKPTSGNVSLIVNSIVQQNVVSTTASSLIPVPKTKLLSPLMHSDIHGWSNKGPNNLTRKHGDTQIDSSLQAGITAGTDSELRTQRIRRHSEDTTHSTSPDTLPSKHPKLDGQSESQKSIFGISGGGIIAMSAKDTNPKSDTQREGLLQIAKPGLFAGGGVLTSKDKENDNTTIGSFEKQFSGLKNIVSQEPFNIPGIPTPHMSGILTGIKPNTSLFSLPGKPKAFEIIAADEKSTGATSNATSLVIEPIKTEAESKSTSPAPNERHIIPFVPGIPGPYSQSSTVLNSSSSEVGSPLRNQNNPSPKDPLKSSSAPSLCEIKVEVPEEDSQFRVPPRPMDLPLTPGSFKPKKHVMLSQSTPGGPGATLVSPETPRPRKCYALQYQNGTAYTYLGLKRSTRMYFCTLSKPQPFYVINKPRLSMYSHWKVVSKDSHPSGLAPSVWLGCYNSTSHPFDNGIFTTAKIMQSKDGNSEKKQDNMIMTHSSKWKKGTKSVSKSEDDGRKIKDSLSPSRRGNSQARSPSRPQLSSPRSTMSGSGSENESNSAPDSIRRVEGGYKSSEDVKTYVRGRGRGRYVCDSCGIRCKKPSMLKKHAKTHSDMRPYTCRYCNFAFKTKGNLTKHMKSKAHHKKCVEIGISPIPMSVEDLESRQGSGEGPSIQQGDHPNHGILFAGDDSDNELEIDENESGDEDEGQFDDADEESEATGQESDGTQSPKKHIYNRNDDNSNSSLMKSLGLLPSRPRPSTFPYIPSEATQISPTPSTSNNMPKSENVSILPSRPQIQVDLAPSSITENFISEKTIPLLAQPQSGSQERYYFSSTVTTNSISNSQPSYGGDAKLAADVIALSSKTPSTSSVTTSMSFVSSIVSSSSIISKPAAIEIIATSQTSPQRYPVSENLMGKRASGDPLPGSVSIFKTTPPPNQQTSHVRYESQESSSHIPILDKDRAVLTSVSDAAMPYYLDKALTARSKQLLQPNNRKVSNHLGAIGSMKEPEVPSGHMQTYLQERAVHQAARTNSVIAVKDDKPPDNVVAPNNSNQRINHSKSTTINPNLEATCQAIMAQSNSTMQAPQGGVVVVLDKKNSQSVIPVTSAITGNITLAPIDSLQNPKESNRNIANASSPTPSSNTAMFKQDITYAPRNVTMNVNDMPTMTSSSIVHHHPQLPQNIQLAANAANASNSPFNLSFSSSSNSKNMQLNGVPNQTSTKTSSSNPDQNSNVQTLTNNDGSPQSKRMKLEVHHNNLLTPTKANDSTGSNETNRASDSTNNSHASNSDLHSSSSSDSGRFAEFKEIMITNEEGKPKCGFCHKVFPKQSQLRLHVNIHYFERPFRCEACAVSFRTKGHLQKHKRSTGHFNKVNINATFGTPSNTNPRPFKCTDCKVAFRIHGHLAKHLRSKMHIMKLECSGKLPIGMFAEMERLGTNLNEIDTKDCERSLESLQEIAVKLYNNDPSKLTNTEDVPNVQGNNSDVSDNEEGNEIEVKEEPVDNHIPASSGSKPHEHTYILPQSSSHRMTQQRQHEYQHHDVKRPGLLTNDHYQSIQMNNAIRAPISYGNQQQSAQPHYIQANHLSQSVSLVPPPNQQIGPRHPNNVPPPNVVSPSSAIQSPLLYNARNRLPNSNAPSITNGPQNSQPPSFNTTLTPTQPPDQPRSASVSSSHLSQDDASTTDSEPEGISSRQPQSCQQCSKTFPDMKSLQIHIFIDHHSHSKGPLPNHRNVSPEDAAVSSPPAIPNNPQNPFPSFNVQHQSTSLNQHNPTLQSSSSSINEPNQRPHSRGGASSSNSSIASEADKMFKCDLCGLDGIPHRQAYKEHLESHTTGMPLRPFVCRECDAGFTSQNKLDSHMKLHNNS